MDRDPHADYRRCAMPECESCLAYRAGFELGRGRLEAELLARLAGPPHPAIRGCAPCKLALAVKVRLAEAPPLMDPAQDSAKTPGAPERLVKPAVRLAESVKSREFLVKLYPNTRTARKTSLCSEYRTGGRRMKFGLCT